MTQGTAGERVGSFALLYMWVIVWGNCKGPTYLQVTGDWMDRGRDGKDKKDISKSSNTLVWDILTRRIAEGLKEQSCD